jgi:hypothetical protein
MMKSTSSHQPQLKVFARGLIFILLMVPRSGMGVSLLSAGGR